MRDLTALLILMLAASLSLAAAPPEYTIVTVAGTGEEGYGGDGGGALCARLNRPTGVDADEHGNVYIADYNNNRIRRVDPAGIITTVAGSGSRGFSGDGGPAIAAELAGPYGVRVAEDGFYIADALNGRVRHVGRNGVIRTVASGFQHPVDVMRGPDGLLYVGEGGGNRVRRIKADGSVEPFAGTGKLRYNGESTLSGDGGPAIEAQLATPGSLAFDNDGNLFIGDLRNHVVRKIDRKGVITTVARGFNEPGGLAFEADGSLLISDIPRIRRLAKDGTLTVIAGTDQRGFSGDHGPATAATLSVLDHIAMDRNGHLLITDYRNNRIRKLIPRGDTQAAPPVTSQPASPEVEKLLANIRAAYQAIAAADLRFAVTGRRNTISGNLDYEAPGRVEATLSVVDYGKVTVSSDGTLVRVIDPMLTEPEERSFTLQNLRRAVGANLEVISLWDSQRQLSTGGGGNMRGSDLSIAPNEKWNSRTWIVLEESAGSNGRYRYYIDPKTSLIWRTVAVSPDGSSFYDGRIERLNVRKSR